MQIVIDIPEDYYKAIKEIPVEQSTADMMIIRNGTPQPKTKWIPVNSGILPKDDERVLVTRRMFHWANEPAEYTVGIESFSGNIDFVAWMPLSVLPEPYKAESEDKE